LEEFNSATVSFVVNGKLITCPKFVEVNGSLEPGSYAIKEGDVIETRSFYTVGQVAEFMDLKIDPDYEILVNNRTADFDTLVYENFSIDWTVEDDYTGSTGAETSSESEPVTTPKKGSEEAAQIDGGARKADEKETPKSKGQTIMVEVNGEQVTLSGKETYIFVDIFDRYAFDLNAGGGRAIVTLLNGREAQYAEEIHNGDKIELYWKEN
jgi:hypothetical protein